MCQSVPVCSPHLRTFVRAILVPRKLSSTFLCDRGRSCTAACWVPISSSSSSVSQGLCVVCWGTSTWSSLRAQPFPWRGSCGVNGYEGAARYLGALWMDGPSLPLCTQGAVQVERRARPAGRGEVLSHSFQAGSRPTGPTRGREGAPGPCELERTGVLRQN